LTREILKKFRIVHSYAAIDRRVKGDERILRNEVIVSLSSGQHLRLPCVKQGVSLPRKQRNLSLLDAS
jgi:hypothetical protein